MRRKRRKKDYIRGPKRFIPSEIVLIVCEGAKTEPLYFEWLCDEWKLKTRFFSKAEIHGEDCGSAPISVVNRAIELKDARLRHSKREFTEPFDQVWCVFDRNGHHGIPEAKEKARANDINVAFSDPCFEYWYLLHFEYTTMAFTRCNEAENRLRTIHVPGYRKNLVPVNELNGKLPNAYIHAQRVRDDKAIISPSTDVDLLVKYLESMKRE